MRGRADTDLFAEVPLFAECSKKDLQALAKRAQRRTADPGEVLVREGEAGDAFFVIVAGDAEIARRGAAVASIGAGDFFGDLALLDRAPRNATVTATSAMELIVLGQRDFSAMLDDAGFARKLLVALAHRLRAMDAASTRD